MAVGGGTAAAEGADSAQKYIAKLTDDELINTSPYYAQMIERGIDKSEARKIISDKSSESAAVLQGMIAAVGDRITSNLLTGSYDKILAKVGGKSIGGRVAAGFVGGAVEEGLQEVTEGVAADIGVRRQITNKEIGTDSAANLILGALGGGPISAARGAFVNDEADPKKQGGDTQSTTQDTNTSTVTIPDSTTLNDKDSLAAKMNLDKAFRDKQKPDTLSVMAAIVSNLNLATDATNNYVDQESAQRKTMIDRVAQRFGVTEELNATLKIKMLLIVAIRY